MDRPVLLTPPPKVYMKVGLHLVLQTPSSGQVWNCISSKWLMGQAKKRQSNGRAFSIDGTRRERAAQLNGVIIHLHHFGPLPYHPPRASSLGNFCFRYTNRVLFCHKTARSHREEGVGAVLAAAHMARRPGVS